MLEVNKIYCGDCLEIMKEIPDKSIDLVLTDPPYGINITSNIKKYGDRPSLSRKKTNNGWDNKVPDKRYFAEIFRVSKNQVVFGANYFWENFYSSQCYIIWDKRGNLPKVPFCDTEFAWTSFNKMSKKYLIRNHGFIKDSKDIETGHPTQKPSELFKMILEDFTGEGDLILDPFMGSGTTAIACKLLNRNFIGIEINPDYVDIANKRLANTYRQMELIK